MDESTKWYRVLSAAHAIYTDPETGEIISENVVALELAGYKKFRYPECGEKLYLLKEGDRVQIKGDPRTGKIL